MSSGTALTQKNLGSLEEFRTMPINCFLHRFPMGSSLITIYSSIFQHASNCYCLLSSVLIHLKTVKLDCLPVFPSCIDIGFLLYKCRNKILFNLIFLFS